MAKAKPAFIVKAKNLFDTAKTYWNTPPKGNYVTYKEIACLSGAGFGVHWATLLASVIGLNASNFLVGACIGLKPIDLQIMLNVANIIGIPLGIFRSWYYDNHHLKGGKFLPFIRMTALPIVLISLIFVWLPYEHMSYITKAVVVEVMYLLLNVFLCFYNESYTYFQQIFSPDAQERATVMSISQVVYSMAPTLSNLLIPLIAGFTWGLDNIWTYRIIYPIFTVIGLAFSIVFFRKVKERLILPKKKPEPVRMFDAIREVAKNKYYWIIQSANWVVFLEGGYGVILGWSFVYAYGGKYEATLGLVNTLIGNAALWSMLLAPFAIKALGKRNLLILMNSINVFVILGLYMIYQNLVLVCVLLYFNAFINTFWNIIQHNLQADMRDYHQWKTGVRVDGLFGPLGMIGTVIGLFTGMVYPAVYEKMGLLGDYSVLYNDSIRNSLFEVLLLLSALGAFLNLVPFFFYDLTENKHKAYVSVLKIRTMFENHALGLLGDEELKETMEIILQAKELSGKEKVAVDKSMLKEARRMPKKTPEDKALRAEAIKASKNVIKETKERNLAIERAPIIIEDLNKFSTATGKHRIFQAEKDLANGLMCPYSNAKDEMSKAKKLPHKTAEEKEIRSNAIKNARVKKEAAALIRKHGKENITAPDAGIKEELLNREHQNFLDSMKTKREISRYMKKESVYRRAIKPYTDAELLLAQAKDYEHYDELLTQYEAIK
ncbi:MAG: MFS transporter [Acutalibacteraceae bacterium]|nr:MFS transporter [Acutalibacteraceae bacterium]